MKNDIELVVELVRFRRVFVSLSVMDVESIWVSETVVDLSSDLLHVSDDDGVSLSVRWEVGELVRVRVEDSGAEGVRERLDVRCGVAEGVMLVVSE